MSGEKKEDEWKEKETLLNSDGDDSGTDKLKTVSDKEESEETYTVEEVMDKLGFGPFQILITVFCGLLWIADAMELMILAILSPILKCQWQLSTVEEAAVTSVVFAGLVIGVVFWGYLNDLIGRKTSLLLVDICILVFGLLSAAQISPDDGRTPGYPWILICRFGVGFSAGGTIQVLTYYAEFLPKKRRGIWLVVIAMWWTIGAMFSALLATLVLGVWHLSWHWYLGLSASPLAIVLLLFPVMPESARFYLIRGKPNKAKKVIEMVARMNCKKPPAGKLVILEDADVVNQKIDRSTAPPGIAGLNTLDSDSLKGVDKETQIDSNTEDRDDRADNTAEISQLLQKSHEGRKKNNQGQPRKASKSLSSLRKFAILFEKKMWQTTILLSFLWFGGAWSHYGVVILTTTMLSSNPHCGFTDATTNSSTICRQLDTGDYVKILWTTSAEFPGLIFTFLIIDVLGRKKTMAIQYVMAAGSFLLLLICTSTTVLAVFLFIARAFVSGVFQVVFVYTPEVYPTEARALGLGVCNVAARVGGILTPVVAQVVFAANDYVSISLYAGSCIVFAILSMLLPIETKGRSLRDK